jgi:hypothetical protein
MKPTPESKAFYTFNGFYIFNGHVFLEHKEPPAVIIEDETASRKTPKAALANLAVWWVHPQAKHNRGP